LYIDGIKTDESLQNHVGDSGWTVYHQGKSSCRESTWITDVEKHGFNDVHAVITNYRGEDGDSGGPLFRIEYDSNNNPIARIAGTIKGGFDGNGDGYFEDTISTTAETTEERIGGAY